MGVATLDTGQVSTIQIVVRVQIAFAPGAGFKQEHSYPLLLIVL